MNELNVEACRFMKCFIVMYNVNWNKCALFFTTQKLMWSKSRQNNKCAVCVG